MRLGSNGARAVREAFATAFDGTPGFPKNPGFGRRFAALATSPTANKSDDEQTRRIFPEIFDY